MNVRCSNNGKSNSFSTNRLKKQTHIYLRHRNIARKAIKAFFSFLLLGCGAAFPLVFAQDSGDKKESETSAASNYDANFANPCGKERKTGRTTAAPRMKRCSSRLTGLVGAREKILGYLILRIAIAL